jgi:cytoskeletal protein CcmA (bactofilin family)
MFSSGRKASRQGGKASGGLSFIGSDLAVSGDVSGTGQLHIDGRVDGNVNCEALVQGEGGTIAGHIIADSAHIAGLVDGTVKARLVTLDPTARVTGDVTYETLSIAAGAAIEGRVSRRAETTAPEPAPILPPTSITKKPAKAPKGDEPGLLAVTNAPVAAAG